MSNNTELSLPESFTITIEMLSDWHIGTGAGITGDIDSLVQRDHNDLPYIPAKTITGIWRDACELVAQGLDENRDNGKWQQWVNYLFGDQPAIAQGIIELSPCPAALSIRAAYLPESLKKAIKSKNKAISQQLKDAITFTKPGIAIDSNSGCAKKDCLRLEEKVRMGATLEANCTLTLPDNQEQKQTASALLIAGAAMIERLGGNRRRGSGKCCLKILKTPYDLKTAVKWIENHPQATDIPKHDNSENINRETLNYQDNNAWISVPLEITLQSPVIISKRTVGNVVETLDYIPGTHLIRFIARKFNKFEVPLIDAITKGKLIITNTTIDINGQKGQPVPFALFYEKLGEGFKKGGDIYNRLVQSEPEREQLKGYRSGYIQPTTALQYETVPLTLGTHNTIKDEYQRPTRDVGGVYSYEAIKTGTKLRSEVRLHKELVDLLAQKNPQWWEQLQGCDRLGQSKKDDYGNVKIKVPNAPEPFQPISGSHQNKLYIWLLSDLLLRDERLNPSVSIDDLARELGKKLGINLTISSDNNELLTFIARQNRLDSWQVKWGLPRPSLVGLGAGTCIVFNIDKQPDLNKLAEIEASGIGERTAEGYGQLCFNHTLLTQSFSKSNTAQKDSDQSSNSNMPNHADSTIKTEDIAFDYANLIETAAWREEIQRQCVGIAACAKKREAILGITINNGESRPSMSQLGALRAVISKLQSSQDVDNVANWIDSVLDKPNRSERWNDGSLESIKKLVEDSKLIWQKINISSDLVLTADAKTYLQGELWAEAVRTLINACILAHKRDLEEAIKQSQKN